MLWLGDVVCRGDGVELTNTVEGCHCIAARCVCSATEDFIGYRVALSESGCLVSAYLSDPNGADSGAAYLFGPPAGTSAVAQQAGVPGATWGEKARLLPVSPQTNQQFGFTVAAAGPTFIATGRTLDSATGYTEKQPVYFQKVKAGDAARYDERLGWWGGIGGVHSVMVWQLCLLLVCCAMGGCGGLPVVEHHVVGGERFAVTTTTRRVSGCTAMWLWSEATRMMTTAKQTAAARTSTFVSPHNRTRATCSPRS